MATVLVSACAFFPLASESRANSRVADPAGGNWGSVATWTGGTGLPGSVTNDLVIIRNQSHVTLNSNVNGPMGISAVTLGALNAVPVLNIEDGAVLDITGGLEVIRSGNIANTTTVVNMTGGTITSGSLLLNGAAGNTNVSATFNFSGGSFTTGATSVGYTATGATAGIFNVIGSAGTMSGTSLAVNLAGTMKFTLDATGVSALGYSGAATFASGSTLTIDGSGYTGGIGTITLINAGSLVGDLGSINDSITGFNPAFITNLVWDAGNGDLLLNISAVPEPQTYAMLGLAMLVIFAAVRRRAASAKI